MCQLNIRRIQESSLTDFPRKIASVVFTQGCNLNCPWCSQGCLIPISQSGEKPAYSLKECLEIIRSRKNLIEGVVITGGEPLLQDELPFLLAQIKKLKLSVKVDTNGTFPHRLRCLLEDGLIDYLALDVKAPLSEPETYAKSVGGPIRTDAVAESVALVASLALHGEFRTTVVPSIHSLERLHKTIQELPDYVPHYLQAFYPENTRTRKWRNQPSQSRIHLLNLVETLRCAHPSHQLYART